MREREEVVILPQLRRRVHGLIAASAAAGRRLPGRPGLGGLSRGRIRGRGLLLGLLRPERGGAGDNVEQPPDVRDGELLRVVLCTTARRGSVSARIFAVRSSNSRVFLVLTFDDAEVAGLEGGDLHRVLELGPTDLHCARRNERARQAS